MELTQKPLCVIELAPGYAVGRKVHCATGEYLHQVGSIVVAEPTRPSHPPVLFVELVAYKDDRVGSIVALPIDAKVYEFYDATLREKLLIFKSDLIMSYMEEIHEV
jgi:hypothetical protein